MDEFLALLIPQFLFRLALLDYQHQKASYIYHSALILKLIFFFNLFHLTLIFTAKILCAILRDCTLHTHYCSVDVWNREFCKFDQKHLKEVYLQIFSIVQNNPYQVQCQARANPKHLSIESNCLTYFEQILGDNFLCQATFCVSPHKCILFNLLKVVKLT